MAVAIHVSEAVIPFSFFHPPPRKRSLSHLFHFLSRTLLTYHLSPTNLPIFIYLPILPLSCYPSTFPIKDHHVAPLHNKTCCQLSPPKIRCQIIAKQLFVPRLVKLGVKSDSKRNIKGKFDFNFGKHLFSSFL
jgi:hypothetical protein